MKQVKIESMNKIRNDFFETSIKTDKLMASLRKGKKVQKIHIIKYKKV